MNEEEKKKKLQDVIYDGHKDSPNHTCCLCECPKNYHIVYWKCPLFDNELICGECCQIGCLRKDIDKRFSEKLGRKITIDEINETCGKCQKNYGFQDEQLADDLEAGKAKDVSDEKDTENKKET